MAVKRILCVGLCNLDIIQLCDSFPIEDSDQRYNPHQQRLRFLTNNHNISLRSSRSRWQRGGNASNNCTVLALLGARCELLATFSDSEHFGFALRDLERRGIETGRCVVHQGCEIPLSTVWLSASSGSRTIVHSNPDLPELTVEEFGRCDLKEYSWVHFEVCLGSFGSWERRLNPRLYYRAGVAQQKLRK